VLPSGQKVTLDLLVTIVLEVDPFRACVLFPALLTFFKCILEVVFCENLQHRLRLFLDKQNGCPSVVFSIEELVQTSLVKKEVWDGALS
jgi:hypothetical protein